MPWESKTVKKIRQEFILESIQKEKSISKLCREYGISRPTAYKWLERFHNDDTLKNKSPEVKVKPRKTPVEKEELILDTRSKHPIWGPRKLQRFLLDKGYEELPATSTIADILKRDNCIAPEAFEAHTP